MKRIVHEGTLYEIYENAWPDIVARMASGERPDLNWYVSRRHRHKVDIGDWEKFTSEDAKALLDVRLEERALRYYGEDY